MEARVWDDKMKYSAVKSSIPKEDTTFSPFRDATFIVHNDSNTTSLHILVMWSKIKFTLEQAMNAQTRSRGVALLFL